MTPLAALPDLDGRVVGRRVLVRVLAGVEAAAGQLVTVRRVQFELLPVGARQRVRQRVKRQRAGQRQSRRQLRGGDERVGRRVGVVTACGHRVAQGRVWHYCGIGYGLRAQGGTGPGMASEVYVTACGHRVAQGRVWRY